MNMMKIRRMSSENIPVDIQEEILKRLPVKPLLRFRSVSKPWMRLIDSPDFILSFGDRYPQPHRFLHKKNEENKYFTSFEDHKEFGSKDPCIVPDLLSRHEGNFVGCSRGLLCFYIVYREYMYNDFSCEYKKEVVVLWNPSIRKSVCIPPPSIYFDLPHDKCHEVRNANGFGVCPVTFDTVILKMKWMDRHSSFSRPWRVAVFTLSTGTWSILSTNLPRDSIQLRGSQVVIDRFIYWLAFDRLECRDGQDLLHFLIMSFDLTAKEFKEINLTGSLTHLRCSIESISKLQESLVLLAYHGVFKGDVSVYSLWMMTKEGGVNTSFSKLYNINIPDTKVKTLLGFRKSGELILVTRKNEYELSYLEIYDPNSEAIVNLGRYHSFFMCSYMESLLLLDELDGFVYPIRINHK